MTILVFATTRVEELAKKRGVSMAQISLAWLLSKEDVSAPIIGTTSLENLFDLLSRWCSLNVR